MKTKKILLGLSTLTVVTAPVVAVVSCGKDKAVNLKVETPTKQTTEEPKTSVETGTNEGSGTQTGTNEGSGTQTGTGANEGSGTQTGTGTQETVIGTEGTSTETNQGNSGASSTGETTETGEIQQQVSANEDETVVDKALALFTNKQYHAQGSEVADQANPAAHLPRALDANNPNTDETDIKTWLVHGLYADLHALRNVLNSPATITLELTPDADDATLGKLKITATLNSVTKSIVLDVPGFKNPTGAAVVVHTENGQVQSMPIVESDRMVLINDNGTVNIEAATTRHLTIVPISIGDKDAHGYARITYSVTANPGFELASGGILTLKEGSKTEGTFVADKPFGNSPAPTLAQLKGQVKENGGSDISHADAQKAVDESVEFLKNKQYHAQGSEVADQAQDPAGHPGYYPKAAPTSSSEELTELEIKTYYVHGIYQDLTNHPGDTTWTIKLLPGTNPGDAILRITITAGDVTQDVDKVVHGFKDSTVSNQGATIITVDKDLTYLMGCFDASTLQISDQAARDGISITTDWTVEETTKDLSAINMGIAKFYKLTFNVAATEGHVLSENMPKTFIVELTGAQYAELIKVHPTSALNTHTQTTAEVAMNTVDQTVIDQNIKTVEDALQAFISSRYASTAEEELNNIPQVVKARKIVEDAKATIRTVKTPTDALAAATQATAEINAIPTPAPVLPMINAGGSTGESNTGAQSEQHVDPAPSQIDPSLMLRNIAKSGIQTEIDKHSAGAVASLKEKIDAIRTKAERDIDVAALNTIPSISRKAIADIQALFIAPPMQNNAAEVSHSTTDGKYTNTIAAWRALILQNRNDGLITPEAFTRLSNILDGPTTMEQINDFGTQVLSAQELYSSFEGHTPADPAPTKVDPGAVERIAQKVKEEFKALVSNYFDSLLPGVHGDSNAYIDLHVQIKNRIHEAKVALDNAHTTTEIQNARVAGTNAITAAVNAYNNAFSTAKAPEGPETTQTPEVVKTVEELRTEAKNYFDSLLPEVQGDRNSYIDLYVQIKNRIHEAKVALDNANTEQEINSAKDTGATVITNAVNAYNNAFSTAKAPEANSIDSEAKPEVFQQVPTRHTN